MGEDGLRRRALLSNAMAGIAGLWLPEWAQACSITEAQTAGPYYRSGAPERTDLRSGRGQELQLDLQVRGSGCRPLAGATFDIWHADPGGEYDLAGFDFRAKHTSNSAAARLLTLMPGRYPGRTAHLHLRVSAPGHRPLVTQLYFPNEPLNARDFLFRPSLLLQMAEERGRLIGRYTFQLQPV